MREFYIYDINSVCYDLYCSYPYQLYCILEDIYYTGKYDQYMAVSAYNGLIHNYNKLFLSDFVHNKFRLNSYYNQKNLIHTVSSNHEYSRVLVSKYSLKLKTNINYSSFFNVLNSYSDKLFVCDFIHQDYFWLSKIVNIEKNLIKQ